MRRVTAACLVLVGLIVLAPSVAFAQATITGIVKDASGAVLPGVTVEAASPDLIEKVRTATTDGDGQYRIIDLRGGTYSVTFSLPGFSTVRREDIQLAGTFVAGINAELKVGALQETVVVTGESPIVDVQSVSRQTTLTNEDDQRDSGGAIVRGADEPDAEHGDAWWRGGQFAGAQHGRLRGRRRPGQRRPPAGRWHQRRHGLQRRRRVRLRRRREQRPGDRPHRLGRTGRSGSRRPDAQHSSEGGRQQRLRAVVRRHRDAGHGREQLHRRTAGHAA